MEETDLKSLSWNEFYTLAERDSEKVIDEINKGVIYLIKSFLSRDEVKEVFAKVSSFNHENSPTWHPCLDGCPDYHRINDEYPKSWVKAKVHSYYFHTWNENEKFVRRFKGVFEMKNYLAGVNPDQYYRNIPSDKIISRLVIQQYPAGGGYFSEHKDPKADFALVQTLILLTQQSTDFEEGGLFVRGLENQKIYLDKWAEPGDMLILSPNVSHGVDPIDPDQELDWQSLKGRWVIIPLNLYSDENMDVNIKPKMTNGY